MRRKWIISLLVLLAFCLIYFVSRAAPARTIQVSFINVGEGDAALIRDNGFDVLIDGGQSFAGPTVVAYLRQQGITDLDVMLASHADSDHIGGLIDVLNAPDITVQQVLYNGYPGDTTTWSTFATAVANEGVSLTAAQFPITYTWGEMTAHILNPAPGLGNPETNDASVVVLLDHGQNHFLFTGDIDGTIEATVVARGTPVTADVLKVAHHGSKYSSSAVFLSAVNPKEAVISVGNNSYGHPAAETISRLLAAGARVWRTDINGTIVITSDGTTYTVEPSIVYIYLPLVIKSTPQPAPTFTPRPPYPTPSAYPTQLTRTSPPATTSSPFPTPTGTAIPPTVTYTPTSTPTSTPTQGVVTTGNVAITYIYYNGAGSMEPDEYVEIRNDDYRCIQLYPWLAQRYRWP
jgi:beta-lactamase superfamily II metal-dependent hydrolase